MYCSVRVYPVKNNEISLAQASTAPGAHGLSALNRFLLNESKKN
jgi:hypothetical protein